MKRSIHDWCVLLLDLIFLSILHVATIVLTLGLGIGTASVAMYEVCFKKLALTDVGVLRDYACALKNNFKSTWLLNLLLASGGYLIWFYIANQNNTLLLAFNVSTNLFLLLIIAFIFISALMYFLPLLAYFRTPLRHAMFSAFVLSINYFLLTLLLYVLIAALLFLIRITNGFSVLFLTSGYAYISALILRPVFEKHKESKGESNEA